MGPEPHPDTRPDRSGHRSADGLAAARHPGARVVRRRMALRANVTFADAVYVALAAHLGADLLSDDGRLAKAPGLPVRTAPAMLTPDPSRPSRQTPRVAAVRFGAVAC